VLPTCLTPPIAVIGVAVEAASEEALTVPSQARC
jgi:hypothetical protein